MGKKFGWLLFIMIGLTASGLLAWQVTHAQTRRSNFPETGHVLRGEFFDFYWSAEDPIKVYGYPITDETTDITTGRPVQYFQRAVFMLFPDATNEFRIQMLPLGEYLYTPGEPVAEPGQMSNCRQFPESGKQVCYAFRDFYEAHGDIGQFGYPISNFEYQFGRIVQYFQRARFEWYPEMPSGQRVKIADVGSEYFYKVGEDPWKIPPIEKLQSVMELKVRAVPENPVVDLNGNQTIHVIVQDQNHQPVPGADVEIMVQLPSGEAGVYNAPSTDQYGISSIELSINTQITGRALVWVNAKFSDVGEFSTETSFRIWW